jgi:hypothetical protein
LLPLFIFLVLSTIECILIALVPAVSLLTTILWGATLITAGTYISRSQLYIVFLTNLVLLFILLGSNSTLLFLLFFGLAGITMSYLANCDKNYYFIQRSGVITVLIGMSIFLSFFYYGTDQAGLPEQQAELKAYMQEAVDNFEESDFYQIYEEQGITKADIEESFNDMVTIIFNHLPALYSVQGIMVIFFMLFLAERVSQTYGNKRLKKQPFVREIMPWQLVWIFIAGLGLWLWGREQASNIYYAGSNILAIVTPIALYYGLSVVLYLWSKTHMKKNIFFMIFGLFFILIFTIPFIILLILIGLFDALIDYRKIRLQEEG